MGLYQFRQVDVFTTEPCLGNPVAVVLGADDLNTAQMQQFTNWTNLSEATYVVTPTASLADYRLRVFSPAGELSFAGHPTIGSAHAVLESGILKKNVAHLQQESSVGILSLSVEGVGTAQRIFVRVPEPQFRDATEHLPRMIRGLAGCPVSWEPAPRIIAVGPVWLVAMVDELSVLQTLTPDMKGLIQLSRDLGVYGLTLFSLQPNSVSPLHLRSFAPASGTSEDPVCGSGNAAVAAFLASTGLLRDVGDSYIASQGEEVGRAGSIHVRVSKHGQHIEIGGAAVTVLDGVLHL